MSMSKHYEHTVIQKVQCKILLLVKIQGLNNLNALFM